MSKIILLLIMATLGTMSHCISQNIPDWISEELTTRSAAANVQITRALSDMPIESQERRTILQHAANEANRKSIPIAPLLYIFSIPDQDTMGTLAATTLEYREYSYPDLPMLIAMFVSVPDETKPGAPRVAPSGSVLRERIARVVSSVLGDETSETFLSFSSKDKRTQATALLRVLDGVTPERDEEREAVNQARSILK